MLAIALSALIFMALACDPVESFTFVNSTQSTIEVTYYLPAQGRTFKLGPGESASTEDVIFSEERTLRVVATRQNKTIFEKVFAYKELKATDFHIDIRESTSPSPSSAPP